MAFQKVEIKKSPLPTSPKTLMKTSLFEKLILVFTFIGVISIFFVSSYSYHSTRKALISRTFDQLTSVRIIKKKRVEQYFIERFEEIATISKSHPVKRIFYETKNSRQFVQQMLDFLKVENSTAILKSKNYLPGLYFTDNLGELMYFDFKRNRIESDSKAFPHEARQIREKLKKSATSPIISNFDMISVSNNPDVLIGISIPAPPGKKTRSLLFCVSMEPVTGFMVEKDSLSGLGMTGESYLVGSDSLFRTPSRFISGSVLRGKVRTVGFDQSQKGLEGTALFSDYRGVEVLSSYGPLHIQGVKWAILAEIDFSEAMIPVNQFRNEIIFLSVFIFLIVFIAAFLLAKTLTNPLRNLEKAVVETGKGNYKVRLEIQSSDEIGLLTRSFNEMATRLEKQSLIIHEREERLTHFYKATPDAIVFHRAKRIILVNDSFCNLTGYTPDESIGLDVRLIYHSQGVSTNYCETNAVKKNSQPFPVEILEQEVDFEGEKAIVSIIRDISGRKEMELQLGIERTKRLRSVIDGQESERQRLSRELHDGLGQSLIAAKLKLESLEAAQTVQIQQVRAELRDSIDGLINDVREISNNLMPAVLRELGLFSALRTLCRQVSSGSGIEILTLLEGHDQQLGKELTIYIYRIIQEALSNVVRHSRASLVDFRLEIDSNQAGFSLRDNGIGFILSEKRTKTGNGLSNIRERVNLLKGDIFISTEPGAGTAIVITIPLTTEA